MVYECCDDGWGSVWSVVTEWCSLRRLVMVPEHCVVTVTLTGGDGCVGAGDGSCVVTETVSGDGEVLVYTVLRSRGVMHGTIV